MIKLKKIDGYLSYLSDKTFICDLPEKEKKILEKIKREK
jgi:hypothetical protein